MTDRIPAVEKMQIKDITVDDILTSSGRYPDRPKKYPPSAQVMAHALILVSRLNQIQLYWERQLRLTSGYRPREINKTIKGAANNSLHIIGAAADIADPDWTFAKFCNDDVGMLENCGLYMEDTHATPGWVHLQCFAPRSGMRVFKP